MTDQQFNKLLKSLPEQVERLYEKGLLTREEIETRNSKGYSEWLNAYLKDYHTKRKDSLYECERKLQKIYPEFVRMGRSFRLDPILRRIIMDDLAQYYKLKKITLEEEKEILKKLF